MNSLIRSPKKKSITKDVRKLYDINCKYDCGLGVGISQRFEENVQEQQEIIEKQQSEIDLLKQELQEIKALIEASK